MKQQLYFKLLRHRTNEVIYLDLDPALEIFKKYDEKQQFMTQLGQENFWKKNRLDLWSALTDIAIDEKNIPDNLKKSGHFSDAIVFKHTSDLFNTLRWELVMFYTNRIYEKQIKPKTDTLSVRYNDWIWDENMDIRRKNTRSAQVIPSYFHIRNTDVLAFEQEYTALLNKYSVDCRKDIKQGRQSFDPQDVAPRYVAMTYGLKTQRYSW